MLLEVRKLRGINRWYYRLRYLSNEYKGWLMPVDVMNKNQAKAAIADLKANLLVNRTKYDPTPKKIDVKSVFDNYAGYLEEHKPSTWKRLKYMFDRYKFFHGHESIDSTDIKRYQKNRLTGGRRWGDGDVSGSTVNRELEVARAAFNRAIKVDKIWKGENPFQHFDRYEEKERDRFLSVEELNGVIEACRWWDDSYEHRNRKRGWKGYMHDIVMLAIMTGRRKDEILKLHKSNIDLEEWSIVKRKTGTNKYKKDEVTPIAGLVREMVKKRIEDSASGYLFENPKTGNPYNGIKKSWTAILKKAGVEDFRFHDNRHTFGTYANMVSHDIKGVSETIGHSTIAQTAKYVHTPSPKKVEIITLVNDLISTLVGQKTGQNENTKNQLAEITTQSAQSLPASGAGGRKFESSRPDQKNQGVTAYAVASFFVLMCSCGLWCGLCAPVCPLKNNEKGH